MTDQSDKPRDAHVQVLTAEVRTLVVGSRQVTLSVYNQLDEVPPLHVEPFGRVEPRNAENGYVHIVGKRAEGGDLVKSRCPVSPVAINSWLTDTGLEDAAREADPATAAADAGTAPSVTPPSATPISGSA